MDNDSQLYKVLLGRSNGFEGADGNMLLRVATIVVFLVTSQELRDRAFVDNLVDVRNPRLGVVDLYAFYLHLP